MHLHCICRMWEALHLGGQLLRLARRRHNAPGADELACAGAQQQLQALPMWVGSGAQPADRATTAAAAATQSAGQLSCGRLTERLAIGAHRVS